ncbi:MAG: carboxypeptidase-like regulatory domain-containing protein [Bacteroidia bacterium]
MSSISRDLPQTFEDRYEALGFARNKRDSIPAANNPLTAATNNRLDAIWLDINTKRTALINAKATYNGNTVAKNTAGAALRLLNSHFIQVFNFGVARGKYPKAHRDYYTLPVEDSPLPDFKKDSDALKWGNYIVDGDALRMAAGGLPMSNPDAVEMNVAKTTFSTLFTNQSTYKDALDNAQEALEAIEPETDKVIKKIWDELEAYYNEETDESRRENMREWGVVYVTTGNPKVLSGTVTYNGAPGAGLVVRFKRGKNKTTANAAGAYSLNTSLMGNYKIVIEKLDEFDEVVKSWEFEITLPESGDRTENFTVND